MTGLSKGWLQTASEERKNVVESAAATTDRIAGLKELNALRQFGLLERERQIPMLHGFVLGVIASYRVGIQLRFVANASANSNRAGAPERHNN